MTDINQDEWTANANDVLHLSLVSADGSRYTFHPDFTYPIYGDTELIYGYEDLSIDLQFDAKSLLPYLKCSYSEKLPGIEKGGGDDDDSSNKDPLRRLLDFMNESDTFISTNDDSDEQRQAELNKWEETRSEKFEVPGRCVSSFSIPSDKNNSASKKASYKLFKSDLTEARLLHLRLQIFVLLFIEAGSYIDLEDDRWELYTLYRTAGDEENGDSGVPEEIVGFCTVYPYFWYANGSQHDSESEPNAIRKRISQFVILPPHQGKRLGAHMYSALVEEFLADESVHEITVEDPSEAFDDLRDRCDLERLYKGNKIWPELKLPLDPEWVSKSRAENKMAPRQFDRCLEMALLQKYSPNKPDKSYRLFVKKRLYIRNREALNEMDPDSQHDKIDETYERLIEDYRRIMGSVSFTSDRKGKKRAFTETD